MYSKISVTLSLDSIEGVECVDVVGPTLQEILCFLGRGETHLIYGRMKGVIYICTLWII